MEGIFTDWKNSEYRGSDDRDVAFGVECDVGALEGLEYEVAEHTTVESGEDSRATDSTTLSGIICCAKGESFLLCGGGQIANATGSLPR